MQDLTLEQRIELTRAIVGLLDDWGLRDADKIRLLALPQSTRPRAMRRYADSTPFPDVPEVNERIEHLVGIADALRTAHPRNAAGGTMWLNRCNYRFDHRSPLTAMLDDGLEGIMAVRVHLDCAWDWHVNGT